MEEKSSISKQEFSAIAKEIDEMFRLDQEARNRASTSKGAEENKEVAVLDKKHTERMREIVAKYGWPTATKVGEQVAHHAWLLIQHADNDIAFQKKCLGLMQSEPEGEVSKTDVAYLVDRVRVNEGQPQVYGTQFWTHNGVFGPRLIEDEEHVDERRQELGLSSLAEYGEIVRKSFNL